MTCGTYDDTGQLVPAKCGCRHDVDGTHTLGGPQYEHTDLDGLQNREPTDVYDRHESTVEASEYDFVQWIRIKGDLYHVTQLKDLSPSSQRKLRDELMFETEVAKNVHDGVLMEQAVSVELQHGVIDN